MLRITCRAGAATVTMAIVRRAIPILCLVFAIACGDDGGGGGGDTPMIDGAPADGPFADAQPVDCAALSLYDCRRTEACAADLCPDCDCEPTFEGCRDANDEPFPCQPVTCGAAATCCGLIDNCEDDTTCAAPGAPPPCGPCIADPGDCTQDSTCAAGDICEPIHCQCSGESACVPGCTAGSCPDGESCDMAQHPRCVASTCSGASPCPADFDCEDGSCQRRVCTTDVTCDGFCVLGLCYSGRGECRPPGV